MIDIFNEISEEIKRENAHKLMRKYAPYIIGIIILILLVSSISIFLSNKNYKHREEMGEIYHLALLTLKSGDQKTSLESMDYLINNSKNDGYGVLASLQKASIFLKDNKVDEAITVYDSVLHNSKIDPSFRSLAGLLAISYLPQASNGQDQLLARYDELLALNGPYNSLVKLYKALWLLKNNQLEQAKFLLEEIVSDKSVYFLVQDNAEGLLKTINLLKK